MYLKQTIPKVANRDTADIKPTVSPIVVSNSDWSLMAEKIYTDCERKMSGYALGLELVTSLMQRAELDRSSDEFNNFVIDYNLGEIISTDGLSIVLQDGTLCRIGSYHYEETDEYEIATYGDDFPQGYVLARMYKRDGQWKLFDYTQMQYLLGYKDGVSVHVDFGTAATLLISSMTCATMVSRAMTVALSGTISVQAFTSKCSDLILTGSQDVIDLYSRLIETIGSDSESSVMQIALDLYNDQSSLEYVENGVKFSNSEFEIKSFSVETIIGVVSSLATAIGVIVSFSHPIIGMLVAAGGFLIGAVAGANDAATQVSIAEVPNFLYAQPISQGRVSHTVMSNAALSNRYWLNMFLNELDNNGMIRVDRLFFSTVYWIDQHNDEKVICWETFLRPVASGYSTTNVSSCNLGPFCLTHFGYSGTPLQMSHFTLAYHDDYNHDKVEIDFPLYNATGGMPFKDYRIDQACPVKLNYISGNPSDEDVRSGILMSISNTICMLVVSGLGLWDRHDDFLIYDYTSGTQSNMVDLIELGGDIAKANRTNVPPSWSVIIEYCNRLYTILSYMDDDIGGVFATRAFTTLLPPNPAYLQNYDQFGDNTLYAVLTYPCIKENTYKFNPPQYAPNYFLNTVSAVVVGVSAAYAGYRGVKYLAKRRVTRFLNDKYSRASALAQAYAANPTQGNWNSYYSAMQSYNKYSSALGFGIINPVTGMQSFSLAATSGVLASQNFTDVSKIEDKVDDIRKLISG